MIGLFHFITWAINHICINLRNSFKQDKEINEVCFEENMVINNISRTDAEVALSFDPPVYCQRYAAVVEVLLNEKWRENIKKVVDFGCAELSFFKYLKNSINIEEVLLVDIDRNILEYNANRIHPYTADYLNPRYKPLHVEVLQGSIDSPDVKLISVDAVICIEIIEHLYPDTLDAFPHNIFYFIEPLVAIFTTPNADFNVLFPSFSGVRHYDHKFEWTRQQFEDWAHNIVVRYPKYSVSFLGIGSGPKGTEKYGCCSQMAVFEKKDCCTEDNINKKKLLEIINTSTPKCNLIDVDDTISDFLSHGVCKYNSFNSNKPDNILSRFSTYEILNESNHPYEVDNRSQEEIILCETQYRIHRLGHASRIYYNFERDRTEIPLYKLIANEKGEFISVQELRKILEKADWHIEECEVNNEKVLCVIYEDIVKSESSEQSQLSDFNYSTDVNWDSESQWNLSTDFYDNNMGSKKNSISTWDDTENTPENDTLIETDRSPDSDPSVNGEHPEHNFTGEDRVELLFDSGYQVSTSSIELSPDESNKEWCQDEISKLCSDSSVSSDKPYNKIRSEAQINRKNSSPLLSRAVNNIPVQPQIAVVPFLAPVVGGNQEEVQELVGQVAPIVENGDLANNNRDLEGNNYQAIENVAPVDDNARLHVPNLDEHNENHIVLENHNIEIINPQNVAEQEPIRPEYQEEEDGAENLDDASREVLFDQNSEFNISIESIAVRGHQIYNDVSTSSDNPDTSLPEESSSNATTEETFHTSMGFPLWLLQILDISREVTGDVVPEDAHFFSQGDGLGIHPSAEDEDDESTSSSNSGSDNTVAVAHSRLVPVILRSVSTDDTDDSTIYEDAVESSPLHTVSVSTTLNSDETAQENDSDVFHSNQENVSLQQDNQQFTDRATSTGDLHS